MDYQPGDDEIRAILENHRTVAVIGLSRNPSKDSYEVAEYLQKTGYRIVPVNPVANEILGEKSYATLLEIPNELVRSVGIVDIFRPPEAVPAIVKDAVKVRKEYGTPHVIWMQLEIVHEEAAKGARANGMWVVMDRCMKVEHMRLLTRRASAHGNR